jgi:hypothetical protein
METKMKLTPTMVDGLRAIAAGKWDRRRNFGWINTVRALTIRGLVTQVGAIRPQLVVTPEGRRELEHWPE